MKKYSGYILIVEDDEHVVLTTRMILKQYFENIDSLSSPKTLETRLRCHPPGYELQCGHNIGQ